MRFRNLLGSLVVVLPVLLAVASCSSDPEAGPPVTDDASVKGGDGGSATCGVGLAALCDVGEGCAKDADCKSEVCEGSCVEPSPESHADGVKNAGETDVDCGGPYAPDKCALTKACKVNEDCALDACASGVCVKPSATDKIQNGGETDVDCGGAGVKGEGVEYTAPRCLEGQKCGDDADCKGNACSPAGLCVPRSCDTAETAGISTCGAKEVSDPAAKHESCCRSLKLPTRNKRLDKYEVTAGRFRAFLTSVGPNVRQWVSDFKLANPDHALSKMIASYPNVLPIYPADKTGPRNVVVAMGFDNDNYSGFRGCYNGDGSYGHNTYWQPDDDLKPYGIKPRTLSREELDAKSLNCAMPIMFAAFCAWDGGELAEHADLMDAWGTATYPWGNTPVPEVADPTPSPAAGASKTMPNSPNYNWCNGQAKGAGAGTGGFYCHNAALGQNGNFYRQPAVADATLANDLSPFIAAPGRFPLDATAAKSNGESWMDPFGNMLEYTSTLSSPTSSPYSAANPSNFCDFSATPVAGAATCTRTNKPGPGTLFRDIPTVIAWGRSWEGHVYDNSDPAANTPTKTNWPKKFPAAFQYGKFGARCARPIE